MRTLISEITKEENLQRAFRRVESARGMAGVDGVSLGDWRRDLHENLQQLGRDVAGQTYRPLPLSCILVARADGSPGPLFMPTVRDRTAQASVINVIEPILEPLFEDDPYSHRKMGCIRHAAQRVKELWETGHSYLVNAGVGTFFDNIDHEVILARLHGCLNDPRVVHLMGQWLNAEVYDGEGVFVLKRGIHRGTVIAPTLARLFLDLLEKWLAPKGQQMVRYGDDLVVLAKTTDHAVNAMEITPGVLAGLELTMDPEDPGIPEFWKELEILGFLFSGDAILTPFDRWPPPRTILFTPPPFDLDEYQRGAN